MRPATFLGIGILFAGLLYGVRMLLAEAAPYGTLRKLDTYYDAAAATGNTKGLRPFVRTHLELLENAATELTSKELPYGPDARNPATSEENWESRFRRTHYDLLTQFLGHGEAVEAGRLVRHVILNRADVPLREDQIQFLDNLVRLRTRSLRGLMENHRLARDEEMRYIARSGKIAPVQVPELTHEQVQQVVNRLSRGLSPDSALGRMSPEDLYVYVQKNPPKGVALHGLGFITIAGGQTYLYKQFHDLPQTDQMFDDLKFFTGQFLTEVCLWFESNGYASASDVTRLIARIPDFSSRQLRQIQ